MANTRSLNSVGDRLTANMCLFNALAVIGGTASAFSTTGTGPVTVDGVMRSLTAQTNTALAALVAADLPASQANWVQPSGGVGFYTQPANTTAYYVIGVNAAGTWKVVQGTYTGQPIAGGYAVGNSQIPDIPDVGFTPVAVMKVVTSGSAFVPATTALTSIATFINVGVLPSATTF
jgi:hypothetical protein